jgi:4a-hydroxytetrahydrobiopterin dehydratase
MPQLSGTDLAKALEQLPNWRVEDGTLVREMVFGSFPDAVRFVQQLAEIAEEVQHHPDIDIRYTRVRLGLVTHDAGGITKKDVDLASKVDGLVRVR